MFSDNEFLEKPCASITHFNMNSNPPFEQKYRSLFDSYDVDHSGRISVEEVQQALQKQNVNMSMSTLKSLISLIDCNNDG